jgi:hypothetical protein
MGMIEDVDIMQPMAMRCINIGWAALVILLVRFK